MMTELIISAIGVAGIGCCVWLHLWSRHNLIERFTPHVPRATKLIDRL